MRTRCSCARPWPRPSAKAGAGTPNCSKVWAMHGCTARAAPLTRRVGASWLRAVNPKDRRNAAKEQTALRHVALAQERKAAEARATHAYADRRQRALQREAGTTKRIEQHVDDLVAMCAGCHRPTTDATSVLLPLCLHSLCLRCAQREFVLDRHTACPVCGAAVPVPSNAAELAAHPLAVDAEPTYTFGPRACRAPGCPTYPSS